MFALITKDNKIVARDFPSRIAALEWRKFHIKGNINDYVPINQNSKKFIEIDYKSRRG